MRFTNIQLSQFTVVCLVIGLLGCSNSVVSKIEPGEITQVPFLGSPVQIGGLQNAQQGSTVHLRGKVLNSAPLVGAVAYELQDSTGQIWVLSKQAAPQPGTEVTIKDILRYQSLNLPGQEQGTVYLEQQ